jgi:hypothetical protein
VVKTKKHCNNRRKIKDTEVLAGVEGKGRRRQIFWFQTIYYKQGISMRFPEI